MNREEKNRVRRERYAKSPQCRGNIWTYEDSDSDQDEKLKSAKKARSAPRNRNPATVQAVMDAQVLVDENLDNIVREDNQSEQGPFIPILNDGAQREETGLGQEPDVQHIQNITLDYQALEFSRPVGLEATIASEIEVEELLNTMDDEEEKRNAQLIEGYDNEKEWSKRKSSRKAMWNLKREEFTTAAIEGECPDFQRCFICMCHLIEHGISCMTCHKDLCCECDEESHSSEPFHQRTFFSKNDFKVKKLLPTEFVVPGSMAIITKRIAVPVKVPSVCPSCKGHGTLDLGATIQEKFVVTLQGRFDLNAAVVRCTNCSYSNSLDEKEYIHSRWWPGATSGSRYLFSTDLLEFFNNLNHEFCGISTNKFISTLNIIAGNAGRSQTIDIPLFDKANREYQNYVLRLDRDVRMNKLTECLSCGVNEHSIPLPKTSDGVRVIPDHAAIDGLFKLPRLASASQGDGESLLRDLIIASNEEADRHLSQNEANINKDCNTTPCGGTTFKAAKEKSVSKKNYKETGLVMTCCRHLVVLFAVNLFVGESYRYPHLLHKKLYDAGYKVVCYDIICLYWKWAEKISTVNEEFKKKFSKLTSEMTSFLPRWHAMAHVWHCRIRNAGHYKQGVGATIGEEMEQVNAPMSLYGNKTKHMTEENRNDEITMGLIHLNRKRILRMPVFLSDRLARALLLEIAYQKELNKQLEQANLTEDEIPQIYSDLVLTAEECSDKNTTGDGPPEYIISDLEATFFEYQRVQKQVDDAVYCIPRSRAVRQRNAIKKRADKLISKLNEWKCEQYPDDEDKSDFMNMDDFLKGFFPWQIADKKSEFKTKCRLVETYMLYQRYKEEILLVQYEMKIFLFSIKRSMELLKNKLQSEIDSRVKLSKAFMISKEIDRLDKVWREANHLFQNHKFFYDECDSDEE